MNEISHPIDPPSLSDQDNAPPPIWRARYLVRNDIENAILSDIKKTRLELVPHLAALEYVGADYEGPAKSVDELISNHNKSAVLLTAALQFAISIIQVIEAPVAWPTAGFDKQNTIDILVDLLPDRTNSEIEFMASVHDLEKF